MPLPHPGRFLSMPANSRLLCCCILALAAVAMLTACTGGVGGGTTTESTTTAIITQPASQSVVVGSKAIFTVVASAATGYQWQSRADDGTTFTNLSAATAASFTTPVTTQEDSGNLYRVVVSGATNSVTSAAATLTVTPAAPGITAQPANITITVGNTAQFTAAASGTSPALKWQISTDSGTNWSDIVGATNASYSVTNVTLGDSGKQYRIVATNSVGTATSNPATLTVIPKAFGNATLIEHDDAGDAKNPQVDFDANGNALVVWQQSDGTHLNIWANRYTTGNGWGSATLIESDNAGDARNPQVDFDANGNALVVWQQSDGTRDNIWANRYTAGTGGGSGWGNAALIESDNAGDAASPQIAFDSSGNAMVVWQQSDGTRLNIWANRYTTGSGWGSAALIESDNAGDAAGPQIAFDASGNAMAVWYQNDGTRFNIWANRYTAGTGWGSAALIESDNAGDGRNPQIALDASGNALAVWQQSDGTRINIWANRYTTGSGWGSAALIESDNTGDAASPQIAFDASGNALAVWHQWDGTRYDIWANRYAAGSGWGSVVLIETENSGNNGYNPQIAFDASGNALAVWYQWDGTRGNIWSNRYDAGSGWGSAALIEISNENAGGDYPPQIAFDARGNALVVWYQWDGTRYNIYANRFE